MLWGVGTSSYQVEGDIQHADWSEFERELGPPFGGAGGACAHYLNATSDIRGLAALGLNAYRFSVEWSRIEPTPGATDQAALDHYRRMVDTANGCGVEPVVTLHHFTLPTWLAAEGGVLSPHFTTHFARFCKLVGTALDASWWVTINEPMVLAVMGYLLGVWPPGHQSLRETNNVGRVLAEAHRQAYQILHQIDPARKVGVAKHLTPIWPHRPHHLADQIGSRLQHTMFNQRFYDWTKGSHDFLGVNFYARSYARGLTAVRRSRPGEEVTQMGWVVDSADLATVLSWLKPLELPVLITENGIATLDEEVRCDYLKSHVRVLLEARQHGLNVAGYLHWTLWDNFEWREGWGPAFGLCPRPSAGQRFGWRPAAQLLAQLCASDGAQLVSQSASASSGAGPNSDAPRS